MTSYGYTSIRWGGDFISFESTDTHAVELFCTEVKRLVPNRALNPVLPWPGNINRDPSCDPSGDAVWISVEVKFKQDKVHASSVGFWVLKRLCLEGWEPFALTEYNGPEVCHHLKKTFE